MILPSSGCDVPEQFSNRTYKDLNLNAFIRDSRTLELRRYLGIPGPEETNIIRTDHYFFFSRSIGPLAASWTEEEFLKSSHVFLRLQADQLSLDQLGDVRSAIHPGRILLRRAGELLEPMPNDLDSLAALAQLYGAEITDAIKAEFVKIGRHRKNPKGLEDEVRHLCLRLEKVIDALRRVRRELLCFESIAPRMVHSLLFAEEYIYAIIDERFSKFADDIRSNQRLYDGSAVVVRVDLIVKKLLSEINHRRRQMGFVRVSDNDENYAYRISLLKKELQKSLYVDTRPSKSEPFFANGAAMIAAGLAAIWATIAQVPLVTGTWNKVETFYLLFGAVFAYVLKDRIKDLVKKRLLKRWKKWDVAHDFGDNILEHMGVGKVAGHASERVKWVSDVDLPKDILSLRQFNRTVRGSGIEREDVLLYSRRLEVRGTDTPTQISKFGIQSILRFSFVDLLKRFDDPEETLWYYDEEKKQFRHTKLPKVYHLNIIHRSVEETSAREILSRTRVVLDRNGIRRIDVINL